MTSRPTATRHPGKTRKVILALTIWAILGLSLRLAIGALAAEPASPAFDRTWQRTDDPVKAGLVNRTWMWGEDANTEALSEPYDEAPGGQRTVQYFDKSRMEGNSYRAGEAPWDVTNGLLVVELITGRMQLGDDTFEQHQPAAVNVAGDPDDPTGVQYQTLAGLLDAAPLADGQSITWRVDRDGAVTEDPALASYGVTAAHHVVVQGIDHQVASPFWTFMNSSGTIYEQGSYLDAALFLNPFYATGYPITEAYWANVKVAGTYQKVLLQCFERRCLTYTPGNDPGWQVEAGNVGLHYETWRYEQIPDEAGDGSPEPSPTATEPPGDEPDPTEPPATPTETPDLPEEGPTPTEPETDTATEYRYAGAWGEMVDVDSDLQEPYSVAVSQDGDVYVADESDLYKYTNEGLLLASWSGENGDFSALTDVAVDGAGNVWVVDTGNKRIQKYSPDGSLLDEIDMLSTISGVFVSPYGIAIDSAGYIYVTHSHHDIVQKFDPDGAFLDEWGDETGEPEFNWPMGIAIDANDTIYVANALGDRVLLLDTDGNELGEWGGAGDPNLFWQPADVAVGRNGDVLVLDQSSRNVEVFDSQRAHRGSWGGNWGSGLGEFELPVGIAADAGKAYIVDKTQARLQVFDLQGNYLDQWRGAHRGRLAIPTGGLAVDGDDNVYLSDMRYGRIQKFEDDGDVLAEFLNPGNDESLFRENDDLVAGHDGYLYAVDSQNQKILKFTRGGDLAGERAASQVEFATGIAMDAQGNLYVSDLDTSSGTRGGRLGINGGRIHKYSSSGAFLGTWTDSRLESALSVAVHGDRVYVADGINNEVHVFDTDGNYLEAWDGSESGAGPFSGPVAVGVGDDGYVYVVDSGNVRVLKLSPEGEYLTEFGASTHPSGQFGTLTEIEVSESGAVFLLDLTLLSDGQIEAIQIQVFEPVN